MVLSISYRTLNFLRNIYTYYPWLDFLLRLFDKPVDIGIGQTSRDDARPRSSPAGD
jgi:hypothetical protein